MNTTKKVCVGILCATVAMLLGNAEARAQKSGIASRVVQTVDDTRTVRLQGNVHPLARAVYDRGALADSQPMTRMLLLLQRSLTQESTLRQLLEDQQTKGTGNFHAWLTPADFGKQFGPSDADVQAVTDWLTRQGFSIGKVAEGRTAIEFSGNVGQVRNTFHTEIHRFTTNGKEHFANVNDPAIPEALAPVVKGVVALHNFPKRAQVKRVGTFRRELATGQVKPVFSFTDATGPNYAVGPADFAKIYNIPAGATGAGQSIAVVGQSNINMADVMAFRHMFGLDLTYPANNVTVILNGPDPGLVTVDPITLADDETESDLDVQWAGAVAPAAQILFVVSQSTESNPTQVTAGIDLSALYIIDNNLAPVMTESFGECEFGLGTSGNAFYSEMWEQAAAEGITVAVSSGDNGSAGCDPNPTFDPNAASQGLAVNGIASTPFNVAVGGTDFNQPNPSTFWNATNAANTQLSALGYIPEMPWNNSNCAAKYPLVPCTSVDQNGADITGGGGGPSNCVLSTSTACVTNNASFPNGGYPKPSFQQGTITPADSVRDLPDVSLFAGNGFFTSSFYVICQSDTNPGGVECNLNTTATSTPLTEDFSGVGGTSAAAPTFAAIIALVNQNEVAHGRSGRQGNANYVLYALAKNETFANCNSSSFTNPANPAPASCTFFDITTGNNAMACDAKTLNCSNQANSGFGVLTSGVLGENGNPAFNAVQGYDLATGLGSINVGNLLTNWSTAARTATTTGLSGASSGSNVSGQPFTVTISVVPAAATGDVSLFALDSGSKIIGSVGPFPLGAGGVAHVTTNLLPPGTANIEGYYGGSTTYGTSTSSPLALAVAGANLPSKTTLSFATFPPICTIAGGICVNTASQNWPYGSPYILQIAVTPLSNNTVCTSVNGSTLTSPGTPCPVGTITLTDGGAALNDWPNAQNANATNIAKLNNQAIAEDQPIQLAPGSHTLQASFTPGNTTNYQASTSNTMSVTITQAATTTLVGSSPTAISGPGVGVTLQAYEVTNSNGAGPTGSVQFSNGSTSLGSATCVPTSGAANFNPPIAQIAAGTGYCVATLPSAIISGLYPPPVSGPRVPLAPVIVALLSMVFFALGWRWMPERRRRAYAYAGLVAFVLLAVGIAGCGGGGGGGGGGTSTRTINAVYAGDTNYKGSSGSTQITVN